MTNPLDQVIAAIGTNITSDPKQFQFNTTFATGDLLVYQGKLYTVDVGGGTSSSGLAPTQWPHDSSSTHTLYGDDDQVIMASTKSLAASAGATVVSGHVAGTDDFGTAWSSTISPFTSSAYTSSDPVPLLLVSLLLVTPLRQTMITGHRHGALPLMECGLGTAESLR